LVLLSAPKAVAYYPKIGFIRHESAWILRADEPLTIPAVDSLSLILIAL